METNAEKKTSFFTGIKTEFKKVIWPDKKTAGKQTLLVVACAVVLGVIIAYLDQLIKFLISVL